MKLIGEFEAALIYRGFCMLCGLFCVYLGYRLYCQGVLEKEGEIKGKLAGIKFTLKNVAPGVIFVIAGALIMYSNMEQRPTHERGNTQQSTQQNNSKPQVDLP